MYFFTCVRLLNFEPPYKMLFVFQLMLETNGFLNKRLKGSHYETIIQVNFIFENNIEIFAFIIILDYILGKHV